MTDYRVTFDLGCLDGRGQTTRTAIATFVEALSAVNERFLRDHPEVPKLYECKRIRYIDDGGVSWKDLVEIMRTQMGNCQSLSAWRLAELRTEGENASVHLYLTDGDELRYHVAVRRASGAIEDPSKNFSVAKTKLRVLYTDEQTT